MTAAPEEQAERAKLARLLGLSGPEDLACLDGVPAAEVRAYREQTTELLFDAVAGSMRGLADASRLLPAKTLAAIAHRALGPLVCGRLASLIDPGRAADVAGRLPVDFLAQVAAEVDPRRVAGILQAIDPETIVAAALQMVADGEDVAMGRFVAHLDRRALHGCIEAFDDATLIRVAFVLDDKAGLDDVFTLVDDERARGLPDAAAAAGLEGELANVEGHLTGAQHARMQALRVA